MQEEKDNENELRTGVLINGQIMDYDLCSESLDAYSRVKDQLTYLGFGHIVYVGNVLDEQAHCWVWKGRGTEDATTKNQR